MQYILFRYCTTAAATKQPSKIMHFFPKKIQKKVSSFLKILKLCWQLQVGHFCQLAPCLAATENYNSDSTLRPKLATQLWYYYLDLLATRLKQCRISSVHAVTRTAVVQKSCSHICNIFIQKPKKVECLVTLLLSLCLFLSLFFANVVAAMRQFLKHYTTVCSTLLNLLGEYLSKKINFQQ